MIERYYTEDIPKGKTVYDLFEWKDVSVNVINYKTGESIYKADHLKFPSNYSQNACEIIAKMYFRKSGVPSDISPSGAETSLIQVVERMVNFWVESALDEKIITAKEAPIMHDELAYMLVNQMWAPNSPQWFNTGLYHAYGIESSANGLSYFDKKHNKVVDATDAYSRPQVSACFILGIKDSLLGEKSIMDAITTASRLFKFGSGIGSNWSNLRAEGEHLSSGGTSSGMLSFQKVFDANAGAIKSGGACLAPWQQLYTAPYGTISVKELAETGKDFDAWSWDPKDQCFKFKRARAFQSGRKLVMKLTTNKDVYSLTYDHPVLLKSSMKYVPVIDLSIGDEIFGCDFIEEDANVTSVDIGVSKVVSIEKIGPMEIYDVEVDCDSPNTPISDSGHNFLICSGDKIPATGIIVHNTRRAAVLECVNMDHPEIEEFINWKSKEEDKVAALGKMGYDTSFTGEAYATVSGQNVNNSVSIPDRFMRMVDKIRNHEVDDLPWKLVGRVDSSVDREVSVKKLWDDIGNAAWRCGDPGVQFSDTINDWNTCKNSGRINSSNPCSEYLFLDDTACNLASINVLKFFNDDASEFDIDGFIHAVKLIQYVLDASINWGSFPTREIAENTYKYRTTGLGLTNMGALLMKRAIPYDSEKGRQLLAFLCSLMTGVSYVTSGEMATKTSPFPEWKKNKLCMTNVINKHREAVSQIYKFANSERDDIACKYCDTLISYWNTAFKHAKSGFRNAQVTVLAPTGTIAFAMDCDTTSSEPFFAHLVYKKVIDGSYITMVNPLISDALKKLGYGEKEIDEIKSHVDKTGMIEDAPHINPVDLAVFDTANRCGAGIRYLSPMAHVKMVAALQPHLSGGISKTVNLPADATVEDVQDIYFQAWKLRCKCIALYRDGCKVSQPLSTHINDDSGLNLEDKSYNELLEIAQKYYANQNNTAEPVEHSPVNSIDPATIESTNVDVDRLIRERLPYEPKCIKNAVKMDGKTYHIQRSFYDDGRLGEIFVSVGKQGNTIKGLTEVLCILISKCLQYGVPSEVIADILRNTEFQPNGLVFQHPNIKSAASIPDLISKFIDISNNDYSHCQVKPDSTTQAQIADVEFPVRVTGKTSNETPNQTVSESKHVGNVEKLYGETCPVCGSSHMVKAGTCKYCQDCGTSSGCS